MKILRHFHHEVSDFNVHSSDTDIFHEYFTPLPREVSDIVWISSDIAWIRQICFCVLRVWEKVTPMFAQCVFQGHAIGLEVSF